jgi:hypothetical protein
VGNDPIGLRDTQGTKAEAPGWSATYTETETTSVSDTGAIHYSRTARATITSPDGREFSNEESISVTIPSPLDFLPERPLNGDWVDRNVEPISSPVSPPEELTRGLSDRLGNIAHGAFWGFATGVIVGSAVGFAAGVIAGVLAVPVAPVLIGVAVVGVGIGVATGAINPAESIRNAGRVFAGTSTPEDERELGADLAGLTTLIYGGLRTTPTSRPGTRGTTTDSPALKGSPYHPDAVAARIAAARNFYDDFAERAAALGFDRRIAPQKAHFDSHGQDVFTNGQRFITRDADGHLGGVWKMFDRRGRRLGTFDAELKRIGD